MSDRVLWDPRSRVSKANRAENERMRSRLVQELERSVNAAGVAGEPHAHGWARRRFAEDWVALAERNPGALKMPGEPRRTPLSPGEDPRERHIDAAHTRLRQFQAGRDESDWVLIGVDSVICDRHGLALPSGFYRGQQTLPV